ncbi:hypothetical protein [Dactylosporangium sp. CS-033363]|uniref:hypothetical protein n=1 Tax=Dactylosporangium sp. CS-033363 TaxID=3239935 RepID=UPI003D8B2708
MRTRLLRLAAAALLLTGGLVAAGAGPAAAAPNCDVPNPPPVCETPGDNGIEPTVEITSFSRTPAGFTIAGRAYDPDATGRLTVRLRVGTTYVTTWLVGSTGTFGGSYAAQDAASVCAIALNQGVVAPNGVGCLPGPLRVSPMGYLDEVSASPAGVRVKGWAIDEDTTAPIAVRIALNGAVQPTLTASGNRPDVGAVFPVYGSAHGYDVTYPQPRGSYEACVVALNVAGGADTSLGCRTVVQGGPPTAPVLTATNGGLDATPFAQVRVATPGVETTAWQVHRAPTANGPWGLLQSFTGNGAGQTYQDRTAAGGQTYCYRASASNAYGVATGPASCVLVLYPALPQADAARVVAVTPTSLTFEWRDNANGEDRYRVASSRGTQLVPAAAGTGGFLKATFTGLPSNADFCVSIFAEKTGYADRFVNVCGHTDPPPQVGIKTLDLWNCNASSGTFWLLNWSTGVWTRLGDAASRRVCGPGGEPPSMTTTLPDGQYVTVSLVVLNAQCPVEDPTTGNCEKYRTDLMRGDAKGGYDYRILQ